MIEQPKTWTDEEIVELMVKEARDYRNDVGKKMGSAVNYKDMMECVLGMLKEHGLIEDTP